MKFRFKDKDFELECRIVKQSYLIKQVGMENGIVPAKVSNYKILLPYVKEKDEFTNYINELVEKKKSNTNKFNNIVLNKYPFLYDYQLKTVNKILESKFNGYLIGHEMGLGKSITSIVSANELNNKSNWIVCPASLMKQWQKEIKAFLKEDSIIYNLSKLKRYELYKEEHKWNIISYETLRNDYDNIELQKRLYKSTVICDEASKLKNKKSKIYKTFEKLSKIINYGTYLSGTPLTNGLDDINNIINLIKKYLAGGMNNYKIMEMVTTGWGRNARTYPVLRGYKNLDEYVKKIEPVYFRQTKSELKNQLPPKTITKINIEQPNSYHNIKDQILKELDAFSGFSLLCMLEGGIETLEKSEAESVELIDFPKNKTNPKLETLVELVEEINDQVIIFTHYINTADNIINYLRNKFKDKKIVNIKEGDKDELKTKFLNKEIDILVATDKWSHGVSLGSIDYLINYDIIPSLETYLQRLDRIHRADSKNPKFMYNLIGDIVENHILEILEEKLILSEKIVEGKAVTFNDEDIKKLVMQKLQ